jgi:hypothetical protein
MITLDALKSLSPLDPANRIALFRTLLEQLALHLNSVGFATVPYKTGFPSEKLLSLPEDKREAIINQFVEYYDVCSRILAQKSDSDDRTMAWSMLVKMRLIPLSDVFSHIRPGDIIEIYNQDSVQVFRSFSFFKPVSYTLEELFVHEGWELYRRPETYYERTFSTCNSILKGEIDTTVFRCIDDHVVEEVFSENKTKAHVEEVFLSPLPKIGGGIGGFLHVFRAKLKEDQKESKYAP